MEGNLFKLVHNLLSTLPEKVAAVAGGDIQDGTDRLKTENNDLDNQIIFSLARCFINMIFKKCILTFRLKKLT